MSTPFVRVDAGGRLTFDRTNKILDRYELRDERHSKDVDAVSAGSSVIETHPNGPTIPGSLSDEDGGDMIAVSLVAGQTYTWSYRPSGENGIVDPWLKLIDTDGVTVITEDDDGGFGRSSQITFTADETATYWLNATSWYQADPTAPDFQDNGDYTIVQWSPQAGHDAPANFSTTFELDLGTNYAYLEATFDQDFYKIELTEGMVYTFAYNGGVSSGDDWDDEPGESIGVLALYNSLGGEVVPFQVNYETGLTYVAPDSGTYYLRVVPYSSFGGVPGPEMTGGYTIDVKEESLSDKDPLESLNWDSAANIPTVMVDGVPTAYVYFAPAGENFGEFEPDNVTPMTTFGWEPHQSAAVMHALQNQYTPITGIQYLVTTDVEQATFRMLTTENLAYGARFYPQDPAYGDQAGIGTFNRLSGGFQTLPQSLLPGGFSYGVILHEFGHAHGVAHPHDNGGGSEILLGVTAATGSYGLYNLNQGVYTVMSYNDAWDFHPDGPTTEAANGSIGAVAGHGWSETLGAFDIAVLQARYGEHANNTGNTNYALTDDYLEASYKTIWDTGGVDTISYNGSLDAHIDLLAATLDYSPTGGGVISFLHNVPQNDGNPADDYITEIKGGYTIANGVVIENAQGGKGNDVLLGNSSANKLSGGEGDDTVVGREGNDTLEGAKGADVLYGNEGNDSLNGGDGADVLNGGAGNDVLNGQKGVDLFWFSDAGTDKINGYEKGEDLVLSDLGVTQADVTINGGTVTVELGAVDLIITGANGVTMADIIF